MISIQGATKILGHTLTKKFNFRDTGCSDRKKIFLLYVMPPPHFHRDVSFRLRLSAGGLSRRHSSTQQDRGKCAGNSR